MDIAEAGYREMQAAFGTYEDLQHRRLAPELQRKFFPDLIKIMEQAENTRIDFLGNNLAKQAIDYIHFTPGVYFMGVLCRHLRPRHRNEVRERTDTEFHTEII